MNSELVKEIFRNFENTFIGRLRAIEDILTSTTYKENTSSVDLTEVNQKIDAAVGYIKSVEEYAMGEVRTIVFNADKLEERVSFLERELTKCNLAQEAFVKRFEEYIVQKNKEAEEKPDELVIVEAENETAEAEALEVEEAKSETQAGEEEEEVVEEQEEEEEEEEEETEEEGLNVESFEYSYLDKKTKKIVKITLYHDAEFNVYQEDEEGGIDSTVIGTYDPKTKKFTRI